MTELQLEFIRKFGSKELTEGCLYITDTYICTVRYDDKCYDGEDRLSLYSERHDDTYTIDEILGHPVQWHDVFARLRELGYSYQLINGRIIVYVPWDGKPIRSDSERTKSIDIKFNNCLSPMEQPELIEQLLLLSN